MLNGKVPDKVQFVCLELGLWEELPEDMTSGGPDPRMVAASQNAVPAAAAANAQIPERKKNSRFAVSGCPSEFMFP